MIDFNHAAGSIAPSTMPKAAIVTSEQLTGYIDAGLQRARKDAPEQRNLFTDVRLYFLFLFRRILLSSSPLQI